MNPTLKNILIIALKNFINAALTSIVPVLQSPSSYPLRTLAGWEHLGLTMLGAGASREVVVWLPVILKWSQTNGVGLLLTMKTMMMLFFVVLFSSLMFAQVTPASNAFTSANYSFNLSQITLPRTGATLSGAEQDMMFHFTDNNVFGETTLISSAPFVGGRYERMFPVISDFLQNHTGLTGGHYQVGLTVSLGVVKADKSHYGERAGAFLKYAPNGSNNFDVGIEVQWNNLPGIAHNIPSVVVGPNFRF